MERIIADLIITMLEVATGEDKTFRVCQNPNVVILHVTHGLMLIRVTLAVRVNHMLSAIYAAAAPNTTTVLAVMNKMVENGEIIEDRINGLKYLSLPKNAIKRAQ